jgi:hypothetical protein
VAFFITFKWSSAMEREPIKTDPDGFAEVWRRAEQRRAEDMRGWLGQLFEQGPRPETSDAVEAYPPGHPALR